jgi:uncharacterized membrane protein YjjB (DUF3815 family)
VVSGDRQLVVFCVIATVVIVATTFLVSISKLDATAFSTLVGAIVGGIVGILNPVRASATPTAGEP